MKIEFLCKNYNASDKLKDIVARKVDKLDKFFEEDTKARVLLKKSKDVETLEITISVSGGIVRAPSWKNRLSVTTIKSSPKSLRLRNSIMPCPSWKKRLRSRKRKSYVPNLMFSCP